MEVLVVADSHFFKKSDGSYWAKTIYGYDFWERYLTVFDSVAVVSRTQHVTELDTEKHIRVDGPNVRVIELPYLRGMKDYLKSYFKLRKTAKDAVKGATHAIFRLPSVVSSVVLDFYKATNNPYSIEVVADPYDAYSSNIIAQKYFTKRLKKDVLAANGVSYVTQYYLQSKYPSSANLTGETTERFETYYSTINLKESYFSDQRDYNSNKNKFTIVHTANSINTDSKGHTTVIKILKELRDKSYNVDVIFVGDGSKREKFEYMAKDYGVDKYVSFTGLLATPIEVRKVLLTGDLFVFPTKAEGLPRAIIEAMAVGLPCLSTPVNGIPELLNLEYLYPPNDVNGFSNKIVELIENPEELEKMSKENIEKAKEYTNDKLTARRDDFYMNLKRLSERKSKLN